MLILTKAAFVMMVSFILSLLFGYFIIPILRKKKLDQVLNRSFIYIYQLWLNWFYR